jgi:hypothetical protein
MIFLKFMISTRIEMENILQFKQIGPKFLPKISHNQSFMTLSIIAEINGGRWPYNINLGETDPLKKIVIETLAHLLRRFRAVRLGAGHSHPRFLTKGVCV